MELSLLPSSALRCSDIRSARTIAAPTHSTVKNLRFRISSYASSRSSGPLPISALSSGCSKVVTSGNRWLNMAVRAQAGGGATKSEVPKKNDAFILLKLTRPFSVLIMAMEICAIFARRHMENPGVLKSSNWFKLFAVYISIQSAVLYGGGINQITDVEIDKINKPYLPIASGELSVESAWLYMIYSVAISLTIAGALKSMPFLAFICLSLLLLTIYSVPPFRLKASTFGAPLINGMVQGFSLFYCVFFGVEAALGIKSQMSMPMLFISVFNFISLTSMGILKDMQDLEGDMKNNIPTVASIIGIRKTLIIGVGLLLLPHIGGIFLAITRPELFKSRIMIPAHIFFILLLLYKAWQVVQTKFKESQLKESYATILLSIPATFLLLPFI